MAEVLPRRPATPGDIAERDIDTDDEESSEDEDQELDTTAEQHAEGKDLQGIPWERLHFTRDQYRETRLGSYNNYTNLEQQTAEGQRQLDKLFAECGEPTRTGLWYHFHRNSRAVHATVVHFQLRNLVWATSSHDVYVMLDSAINHWNPLSRKLTRVMNLQGQVGAPGGKVQVSTMAAGCGLLAAGGFTGELAVQSTTSNRPMSIVKVTENENGITNGIDIFQARGSGPHIVASNNDAVLRVYDASTAALKCVSQVECPWAINFAAVQPGGSCLTAAVGDAPEARLLDWRTGKKVADLVGHFDYSFAAAWHPEGNLLATGNQDMTARVWDVRNTGVGSLAVLKGRMGAVRSLRFSPSGAHLAAAEPADFLTLYDVAGGFQEAQEINLFGEIAGTAFSPDGERLFIAIADLTYSSLLEYHLSEKLRGRLHGACGTAHPGASIPS
mmetsp:Transcript_11441/g.34382  ORF Transcript_11441/g.34382 Transcript_11441/m.34382 type:complete len:443 (+) Transcript_11441:236-1564(+)